MGFLRARAVRGASRVASAFIASGVGSSRWSGAARDRSGRWCAGRRASGRVTPAGLLTLAERRQLGLLRRRQRVLDADEQAEMRLLQLPLEIEHLAGTREERGLVDAIAGDELRDRFRL